MVITHICLAYEIPMKRKITINPQARIAYIPKELIDQGLSGELDGYADAVTLTIVNPDTPLAEVERSLEIVLEDIRFRRHIEKRKSEGEDGRTAAEGGKGPPGGQAKPGDSSTPQHPIFIKYARDWISEATGFSKGYLSRVATGKVRLSRSFIERVCFKLGEPESELFQREVLQAGEVGEVVEKQSTAA